MPSSTTIDETFEDPIARPRDREVERKPHLVLALECERPRAGPARFTLDQTDEVVIGRGSTRQASRKLHERRRRLTITVPDRRMSTEHARLAWTGEHWSFEDLGSKNGSLMNGVAASRATVERADLLQFGHTLFFVAEDEPTPPETTDDLDFEAIAREAVGMRTLVPALAKDLRALAKVAPSKLSVLLSGETGTGKEVLARWIHDQSRRGHPLIAVNCGAIPPTLMESQLFGHMKGAFSGAVRDEEGFIRAAHGGTLFLDEIGELPRAAQAALLRVLQENEVVPVGGTRPIAVDIRVVAATHRALDELVARDQFRSDLRARLGGFSFNLPSLRERRHDVGLFIADFFARAPALQSIEPAAAQALLTHDWPHNIRGLEKTLSLLAVLGGGDALEAAHLPPGFAIASGELGAGAVQEAEPDPRLRETLIALLEQHQGNVSEVAKVLGKARQQIHRWLRRLRIDAKIYRRE